MLFFVKIAYRIAHIARVAEERSGGVETLSGDFGDCTVKSHLPADFVALLPGVCLRSFRSFRSLRVLETIRRHADV